MGRNQRKLWLLCFIIPVMVVLCLCGCDETEEVWKPVQNQQIRIAVIGEESFIRDGGTIEAAELASKVFEEKTGIRLALELYDDEMDYHKAIALANTIAKDQGIAAVIVKQEMDYIDIVAEIYEAAEKPFIITNGCYNHTIDNNYQYLLADFINARVAGSSMAQYLVEHGFKRVAFCHSDTEYEEDELKGLQEELEGSGTVLADTLIGPNTQEDFEVAYERWKSLGIDAVCISNYDILNSDLARMLREQGSDIQVVSDYVMDTTDDIETNGEYMDGTVIVPLYITEKKSQAEHILKRFQETYGYEMLEREVQTFDLMMMLGESLLENPQQPLDVMKKLKSKEGYQGIYGTVSFDKKGSLIPNGKNVLVFENGGFRMK